MRATLLLTALFLAGCDPEDGPIEEDTGIAYGQLGGSSVTIRGVKAFTASEIEEGIQPSKAIRDIAYDFCARNSLPQFVSATPSIDDPTRVNYFFLCP